MKTYYFTEEIDKESVEKLTKYLEETEEDIIIYVESNGGFTGYTDLLIYILNSEKNINRVTLFIGGFVISNALVLVKGFKGKKIYSESSYGVIHQGGFELYSTELNNKKSLANLKIKEINKRNLELLKEFNLTEKEKRDYNKGLDIFISNERLKNGI